MAFLLRLDGFIRSDEKADRVLVSLDGDEARRWLRLREDSVRADLLGFEWTNDHCTISVIEVKAGAKLSTPEYSISAGIVTGPAISQMLSIRRLLEPVFERDRKRELITTPARREIIREHLYRELNKGSYTPDQRKLWSDRLQRLLDGDVEGDLRCHLIDVRLGVDSASLRSRSSVAMEGERAIPVQITELNERQIEALVPSGGDGGEPGEGGTEGPPPRAPSSSSEFPETKQSDGWKRIELVRIAVVGMRSRTRVKS